MYVELPSTGCNIIQSATSFYNYSPDSKTRQTFVLVDGIAYKQSETYNQYGYTYTGTCLNTGDLVYKPEFKIYFEAIAFSVCLVLGILLYNLIFKRLRWRARDFYSEKNSLFTSLLSFYSLLFSHLSYHFRLAQHR